MKLLAGLWEKNKKGDAFEKPKAGVSNRQFNASQVVGGGAQKKKTPHGTTGSPALYNTVGLMMDVTDKIGEMDNGISKKKIANIVLSILTIIVGILTKIL